MAVVVLCSATGSPGVTTTALGLALAWPTPTLLVDADRSGGQAILAGYLGGADPQGRGLVALVSAHRERRETDTLAHCLPLETTGERALLPGFQNPSAAAVFEPVWPDLGHVLARISATERDVIVDAGRIGTGLPRALLELADVVLVVARSSLRSLAALRAQLPFLADAHHTGLLVVGPGRPYPDQDIAALLGAEIWADLPWDPRTAGHFSDGDAVRGLARTALWRSLCSVATEIDGRLRLRHAQVMSA